MYTIENNRQLQNTITKYKIKKVLKINCNSNNYKQYCMYKINLVNFIKIFKFAYP